MEELTRFQVVELQRKINLVSKHRIQKEIIEDNIRSYAKKLLDAFEQDYTHVLTSFCTNGTRTVRGPLLEIPKAMEKNKFHQRVCDMFLEQLWEDGWDTSNVIQELKDVAKSATEICVQVSYLATEN